MINYFYEKPKLLFIGINPHHGSFERGVPFSNNKLFWYLLSAAGLIEESRDELRDDAALKLMYQTKFNPVYRLGLVNVVDRPSRDVSELKKGEEAIGREKINEIIATEKPAVVCFVGKVTFQKYAGQKNVDYGWQDGIADSKIFVMHFPLRGDAATRVRELQEVKLAAGI